MTIAADLHNLSENERVQFIGRSVMVGPGSSVDQPPMTGFFVESDAKADRYIRKLEKLFPGIRVVGRDAGPVVSRQSFTARWDRTPKRAKPTAS